MTTVSRPKLAETVLVTTIFCSSVAWSFSFVSFHDAKMVFLWAGVVALALLSFCNARTPGAGFLAWLPAWLGLVVVGTGSLLVAPVPWLTVSALLRTMALLLLAAFAHAYIRTPRGRRHVHGAIIVSASSVAVLALMQRAGLLDDFFPVYGHFDQPMYSVMGNQGLLGGYLALGLVLLAGEAMTCWPRRSRFGQMAGGAAGVVMLIALALSESRAGQLAFLVGLSCYIPALWKRIIVGRPSRLAVSGLAIVLVLALFWSGSGAKWQELGTAGDTGWEVRRWIGLAAGRMALDHPVLGVGLGNFVYRAPLYLGAVSRETGWGNTAVTYHAHFDLLELVCVAGLVGVLFLGWQLSRLRPARGPSIAGLLALAVFSCFHPAWSSLPHAVAAVLLLGMHLPTPSIARPCPRWRVAIATPLPFLLVTAIASFHVAVHLWPSYLLRRAEDIHLVGGDAGSAYRRALSGPGFRGEAYESYGIYLLEQGAPRKAWPVLLQARRELDTGRVYQLLATAAEAGQRPETAAAMRGARDRRWPEAGSQKE